MDETADAVKEALNRVHRNEAFSIVTVKSFSQAITAIFDYIKYILGGIAGISLVVGGIGIMNVMMLTVKERTKEIGLMKAVGATTGNVRNLFLVESTLLGVISGLIGLAVAMVITIHHRRRRRHAHGRVAAERADRPGLRGADDDYRRRIPGQPGSHPRPHRRVDRVKLSRRLPQWPAHHSYQNVREVYLKSIVHAQAHIRTQRPRRTQRFIGNLRSLILTRTSALHALNIFSLYLP